VRECGCWGKTSGAV